MNNRRSVDTSDVPSTLICQDTVHSISRTGDKLDHGQIEAIARSLPDGAENVQAIYPLTPLQEGLLFDCLFHGDGDTYTLSTLFEIRSRAVVELWSDSLNKVIARHDVMRSSIVWEGVSRPIQVIHRHARLHVHELTVDANRGPLEQIRRLMEPGKQPMMALQAAPLAHLYVAAGTHPERWYVLLQVHHLISDMQSLKVFISEALTCLEDREHDLQTPETYADYISDSLDKLQSHEESAAAFFNRKLSQLDGPTSPFGVSDICDCVNDIEQIIRNIDTDLSRRVREGARRAGVSPARIFHAAWALVVANTSGRSDVVYGTVVSVTNHATATQGLLGLTVNTLPLRLQLHGLTAVSLLRHTHRELSELLEYKDCPLGVIKRCISAGDVPLFATLFNYRRTRHETEWNSSSGVRVLARGDAPTRYPITVSIDDLDDDFRITVQANKRVGADRIAGYLETALQSLMRALEHTPHLPALGLAILPDTERRQIIESYGTSGVTYSQDYLIQEIFERQAFARPGSVAAVCDSQSITYKELNDRSNQLARYLRGKGVVPDQLVGICVERGLEMLVGLVGILKAGGAYLPLDPSYPIKRLAFMLEDSAPKILLIQAKLLGRLPTTTTEVVSLDSDWAEIAKGSTENLNPRTQGLSSDSLAYVIYTSGSTGQPKGVMVEHRNVTSLVLKQSYAPIEPEDCVAQCASLSFDAITWEIWATLLNGARLLVVPQTVVLEPSELNRTLVKHSVSAMWLTAGLFNEYVDALEEGFGGLRYLLVGGDVLVPSLIARALQRSKPPQHLVNGYGPTETTTFATTYSIPNISKIPSPIPIGRPIGNVEIYILNEEGEPVPVGAIGEIHIGGAGVSRGYLNQARLTQERFVPNPFSAAPESKLYKSGDLGRWLSNGIIEYLGRNDGQVKIRGFRIEPGEIEAALLDHPRVNRALVLARDSAPGERELVCYVVEEEGSSDDNFPNSRAGRRSLTQQLREYLHSRLPRYMVPSCWMVLEEFPLTPNGKIDRGALPVADNRSEVNGRYAAPSTEIERTVADVWAQLLKLRRVGLQENFFEIGGHSLLATRVVSRLRECLQMDLPVRAIFDAPTVEELSARIQRAARDRVAQEALCDDQLSNTLSQNIASMPDDEVAHRIAELEREMGLTRSVSRGS